MGTISEKEWHWEREREGVGEGVEARGACLKERERERGGNNQFIEVSKMFAKLFHANANVNE